MSRTIKNYWAFTRWGYRFAVLVVLPLSFLILNLFCLYAKIPLVVSMLIGYMYMVLIDIWADYWILGGFYRKSNSALEYLQTSNRFGRIIRDVVLTDTIRRFLLYVGLYLILLVIGNYYPEQIGWYKDCSFFPLLCFVTSQSGVLIARHLLGCQYVYLVASIATLVEGILIAPMMYLTEHYFWAVQGILLVLTAAISIIVVLYSLKKVRDSYYDK